MNKKSAQNKFNVQALKAKEIEFKGKIYKLGKGKSELKYSPFEITIEQYDELQKYFEDKMTIKGFELNFIQAYDYMDQKNGGKKFYCRLGDYDVQHQQWIFSFSIAMNFDPTNLNQQPFMFSPTQLYHKIFMQNGINLDFEVPTTLWMLYLEIITFYNYIKGIAIECKGRTNHIHYLYDASKRKNEIKENDDDFNGNKQVKLVNKQQWDTLMNLNNK